MATTPPRSPGRAHEARLFVLFYVAGFAALLAALVLMFGTRGMTAAEIVSRLPRFLRWMLRTPFSYPLAAAPYVIFVVARSLVRAFRRGGARTLALAVATRVALPAVGLAALGLAYRAYRYEGPVAWTLDASDQNESGRCRNLFERDGKMRGVNLVAGRRMGEGALDSLLRDNVEWVSVTPFGWQENLAATVIEADGEAGYWSESDSGVVELTRMAHARGLRVMLKPHLWVTGGGAAKLADLGPGNTEGWRAWFASYRKFLLRYAALADRAGVDLLVVGAEMTRASTQHPDEWRAMIADTRRVYHGPLTYAANWFEEVEKIRFWDALDYIAVQAYYPLAAKAGADRAALERGWEKPLRSLEALHAKWGKNVIFTEVGWKSTADAAVRPWEWTEDSSQLLARVSTRAQADAYEAFFHAVWPKPWFAGAFIWKWYGHARRHDHPGGADDIDFTPQGKPAEGVMARGYGSAKPGILHP
jgi:hypothetical protein